MNLARALQVFDEVVGIWSDGQCQLPNSSKQRPSACRCLSQLHQNEHDRQVAAQAFALFFESLDKPLAIVYSEAKFKGKGKKRIKTREAGLFYLSDKQKITARKNIAEKFQWDPEKVGYSPINRLEHPAYDLPAGTGNADSVLLCRSAIIALTCHFQNATALDAMKIFPAPSATVDTRERKRQLFQILRGFFSAAFEPDQSTNWYANQDLANLPISVNKRTDWVNRYHLRDIASALIKSVEQEANRQWIYDIHQGHVCNISKEALAAALPTLVERGMVPRGYKEVLRTSLAETYQHIKPVKYRPIRGNVQKDKASLLAVQNYLQPIIAKSLGVDVLYALDTAFLKTRDHWPQLCHYDFKDDVRRQIEDKVYLGFCPLTKSGCYLQVWQPRTAANPGPQRGQVLFIPKGFILILPGDALHGGGFLSDDQTEDLRLHFYIYTRKFGVVIQSSNQYQELSKYAHQEDLLKPDHLHKLFNSDKNR